MSTNVVINKITEGLDHMWVRVTLDEFEVSIYIYNLKRLLQMVFVDDSDDKNNSVNLSCYAV